MIQVYKKSLLDLEFPLYFSICFSELENEENRYKNLGYNGPFPWFVGQSMYNKSHFGWNGHTKNGKTLGTPDGKSFSLPKVKIIIKIELLSFLELLRNISFDWQRLFKWIKIDTFGMDTIKIQGEGIKTGF